MRRVTSLGALAGAMVCAVGCAAASDVATEGRIGTNRAAIRGVDPGTLRAPAYVVTIDSIKVDRAASIPREVYRWATFHHAYAAADKVRVGLDAQLQTADGHFSYPVNPFDCQIGERFDGGELGPLEYTREGSTYTRCLGNPFRPTLAGAPMKLDAIAVHDDETLNVFTKLEVLDPTDAWLSGTGTDISPRQTLMDIGSVVSAAGSVLSVFPPAATVGGVISAIGGVFTLAGYLVNPRLDPVYNCSPAPSLVPGFGTSDPPSDAVSPVLRAITLTGRQLYEATAQGDGIIAYDLDFGSYSSSIMCQRPRTEIVLRIRRVPMEGDPGTWLRARSSTIVSDEPSRVDAFALSSTTSVHDARGYDPSLPLAFEAQGDVWAMRWITPNPLVYPNPCPSSAKGIGGASAKSGCWVPIFPARPNVAALTRRPNEIDLYAIDLDGDLEWSTRDENSSSPYWTTWRKISTGGLFPPGAPISAVSRSNRIGDVFVVARDGSIQRVFQFDASFSSPVAATVAGKVAPWDGSSRGGLVAVPFPWADGVYAIGWDGQLISAWGEALSSSWAYAEHFAAASFAAPAGAQIAAVSRDSNRLDLFVVGTDGLVHTTRWSGAWSSGSTIITPSTLAAPPGAPIAVVSRKVDVAMTDADNELTNNEQMDVFVVGNDGHVVDAHWRYGDNSYSWSSADARSLAATAAPGGAIGAVAPAAGSIFVAAARSDGSLTKTWFEDLELGGPRWQIAP